MNYLSASAYSVFLIQTISLITSLGGLLIYDFNLKSIFLIFFGYFFYSGIGVSLMLHRYYSHNSFSFKYKFLENIFLFFAIVAGRGSPIGWVYVHRLHHAYSDEPRDPHPINWKIFFPHLLKYADNMDKKIVKDLMTRKHLYINRYYLAVIVLYACVLALIDLELLYFFYLIPLCLTFISLNLFVLLSHKYGYNNFTTKDSSKNNWFISLILWGEGWHNNHHYDPSNYNLRYRWWELDLLGNIIRIVKR
jgi:stearoyl-CoA desaturase (delta-9 desaturase)